MTLLLDILHYCDRTGTKISVFGRMTAGDPYFVRSLRAGREVGARVDTRIRRAMEDAPNGMTFSARSPRVMPERKRVEPDDEGISGIDVMVAARLNGAQGSRALLTAMLRLGVTMGGLPGLDMATFRARCAEHDIALPRGRPRTRRLAAPPG